MSPHGWEEIEMRLNKFRSYNKNDNCFYYFLNGGYFNEKGETAHRWCFNWENADQFTGLHDKNGKEIYGVDIVRVLYTDWCSKSDIDKRTLEQYKKDISHIGIVEFKTFEYLIKFEKDVYGNIIPGTHGEIEIIGNIHENPELLK